MISSSAIFAVQTDEQFTQLALQLFKYQSVHNPVYASYLHFLGVDSTSVKQIDKIPCMPVSFFKNHWIQCGNQTPQVIFTSSGTTGMVNSQHPVPDLQLYEQSFLQAFDLFYGSVTDYCVMALLPSYLEREGSSLVYMADKMIQASGHADSGFYLHHTNTLVDKLVQLDKQGQKILLLGVTFALLDMAESVQLNLKNTVVMETGGMKGRRKEMIREEVHEILCKGLGVEAIHSEYGMTELLSQAYSAGKGIFRTPPWMQIRIRDTYDPFSYLPNGRTGGINVIDLANVHSCAFLETQDLGKLHNHKTFEVAGRFDHSDIRGCNLLVL